MSNTRIQIKRSSTTATPAPGSLSAAEPAYSYLSEKLFIGSSDGTGSVVIGGKFFIDQQNSIFDLVNAAFSVTNTGFTSSNSIYSLLNLAFNTTNSAYTLANSNYVVTNAAFVATNAGYTVANAAFNLANTKFAASGGTIAGDVIVTGNLAIQGTTTYVDTETLLVQDPLIFLAANNSSDAVDIGFVGNYSNGAANLYTGLFRSAGDKEFYLFQSYNLEPGENYIDPAGNNFSLAVLNADIITSNLRLNGANAYTWIKTNFDTTNAAYTLANANFDVTNAAYTSVNAAYTSVNASYTVANAAFGTANVADQHAANASYVNTGTLLVNYGGTGRNTFTANGVLFGNGTDGLLVTSAGTEGNVLQVNASGVPQFGMLDGGNF